MIKIGDFLTEGNVIMLHKHLDKSVLFKPFYLQLANAKLINQYRLTYTPCSDLNSVPLYEIEIR